VIKILNKNILIGSIIAVVLFIQVSTTSAVDNNKMKMEDHSAGIIKENVLLVDDNTPPIISLDWEWWRFGTTYICDFIVRAYDNESSIDRVEFFVHYHLSLIHFEYLYNDAGVPYYSVSWAWTEAFSEYVFHFKAIDRAKNFVLISVNGSDIDDGPYNQNYFRFFWLKTT